MVQSKGTRPDSHLLRMDFTGSRKYSGRSCDVRRVGAAGEIEARRGMPTSGAAQAGAAPGRWGRGPVFFFVCGVEQKKKTPLFRKPLPTAESFSARGGNGGRR